MRMLAMFLPLVEYLDRRFNRLENTMSELSDALARLGADVKADADAVVASNAAAASEMKALATAIANGQDPGVSAATLNTLADSLEANTASLTASTAAVAASLQAPAPAPAPPAPAPSPVAVPAAPAAPTGPTATEVTPPPADSNSGNAGDPAANPVG